MAWKTEMKQWLAWSDLKPEMRQELLDAQRNESEADMEERFCAELTFGTGGMRGLMGAGTNRINCYTVAKATRGLAAYVNKAHKQNAVPTCAVAYDSRTHSEEFARITACVLADSGIRAYLYAAPTPTPMLSFAVRYLNCCCGVVITASHNPSAYNGYKVYGSDGCQITLAAAQKVQKHIARQPTLLPYEADYGAMVDKGFIRLIGWEVHMAYEAAVRRCILHPPKTPLRVVYSPLNGTGGQPVRRMLESMGGVSVSVVTEQEHPDGRFLTCPYPNPEEPQAMRMAAQQAEDECADIFLATDPDCDRVGVGEIKGKKARLFTGNEIGVLLLDYICRVRLKQNTLPNRPVAVTTIVTTPLADAVAQRYGVELRRVLTGFKYIGEQIGELEEKNEKERFIFGFEESCGYLSGTYVRDKDGVNGAALICEMAAYHKERGETLSDALGALEKEYGACKTALRSYTFTSRETREKIMEMIRKNPPVAIGERQVEKIIDYRNQIAGLPKSNVLRVNFDEGSYLLLRPSGTEPKLKLYIFTWENTIDQVEKIFCGLLQGCEDWMEGLISEVRWKG